jgi:hypothetical protein
MDLKMHCEWHFIRRTIHMTHVITTVRNANIFQDETNCGVICNLLVNTDLFRVAYLTQKKHKYILSVNILTC